MDDGIKVGRPPGPVFLHPSNIRLVRPLKNTIARNVIPLFLYVFLDPSQYITIVDACLLQQRRQVVDAEVAVWASVTLSVARWMFGQDLLAREWGVTSAPAISVATDIAIHVANVVFIVFVKLIIRLELKGLAPKDEAVLHGKSNAFNEKGVLKTTKVL